MPSRFILFSVLLFVLVGCSLRRETVPIPLVNWDESPSPVPLASLEGTPIPPSGRGTVTPIPAASRASATLLPSKLDPTVLFVPPTQTPTPTPTPTLTPATVILRFASPPSMSRLTSPIKLEAWVANDYIGSTRVELLGEDGRELYRKVFRTYYNQGYAARVVQEIPFTIKGAAEVARLQISTYDIYERIQSYRATYLILLSIGETQLNIPTEPVEHVRLRTPIHKSDITGGLLTIQGEIMPINTTHPFVVELLNDKGAVIGTRILNFGKADGTYTQFETSIPYEGRPGIRIPARLVFRQADDRINGLAYLYSVEVFLKP